MLAEFDENSAESPAVSRTGSGVAAVAVAVKTETTAISAAAATAAFSGSFTLLFPLYF